MSVKNIINKYNSQPEFITTFTDIFNITHEITFINHNDKTWYNTRELSHALGFLCISSVRDHRNKTKSGDEDFRYYLSKAPYGWRYQSFVSKGGIEFILKTLIKKDKQVKIHIKKNAKKMLNEGVLPIMAENLTKKEKIQGKDKREIPYDLSKATPWEGDSSIPQVSLTPELALFNNEELNNRFQGIITMFQWYDFALCKSAKMIKDLESELTQYKDSEEERNVTLKKKLNEYEAKVLFADEILAIKKNLEL